MLDQVRGLYFSGHHLTRDVIGNVAPLTAFAALVIGFSGPAQVAAATIFKDYLLQASFWTFVLALIVYLTGGWFVGSVVAFTANFVHRYLSYVPWYGSKLSYTYWYNKNADDIDQLYDKLFPEYKYFKSGAAVSPTDRINVLKQYFRKYNPDGYAEAYRQFMKVDVVRAALFYSLTILVYEGYLLAAHGPGPLPANWHVVIICCFVLIMTLFELPRRIRKVVRTEYLFIIATARIRDDAAAAGPKPN